MKEHDMIPNHLRHQAPPTTRFVTLCALALALGGCANNKVRGPRTADPQTVTISDFIAQTPDQAVSTTAPDAQQAPPEPTTPTGAPESIPSDGITLTGAAPANTAPGRPIEIAVPTDAQTPPQAGATPPRRLQLLDAKIGDVNGKPIFTGSFFAPIEDRLLAEAQRLSLGNWRASAGKIIASRLDGIIADELLRAEALAALTPNQRVGLQAFLNNFRNNLLSENLGSSQLASRRLQEQEGITLDEALKQKEIDTLVQLTLITEINRRVNVSWRDIKQRYERDIDQFAPPPTAVLRVIRAFASDEDKVQQIKAQLSEGVDFVKIAAGELNNYNTSTDGMHQVLLTGGIGSTRFFAPEALNEACQKLTIGESVGPIEHGSSLYWIKLEDVRQDSVSLYDAQLQIQQELTFERREEAKDQYFERLQERARVSTRDEVLVRLFEIAEQRYAPRQ